MPETSALTGCASTESGCLREAYVLPQRMHSTATVLASMALRVNAAAQKCQICLPANRAPILHINHAVSRQRLPTQGPHQLEEQMKLEERLLHVLLRVLGDP